MTMSNGEIARSYKEAKYKKQQIKILSELNCCDVAEIKRILVEQGVPIQGMHKKKEDEFTDLFDPVAESQEDPSDCLIETEQKSHLPQYLVFKAKERINECASCEEELNAEIEKLTSQRNEFAEERTELTKWLKSGGYKSGKE